MKDHKQIYLIGNPMIWWSSTLAVILYALARSLLILRQKRGFRDFENSAFTPSPRPCILIRFFDSQSCQIRHPLRISLYRLVSSLPPVLPYGTPAFPAPLFSCTLFCHSPLLCHFRSGHEYVETESEVTGCGCVDYFGDLEFPTFCAVGLWDGVDETEV